VCAHKPGEVAIFNAHHLALIACSCQPNLKQIR